MPRAHLEKAYLPPPPLFKNRALAQLYLEFQEVFLSQAPRAPQLCAALLTARLPFPGESAAFLLFLFFIWDFY